MGTSTSASTSNPAQNHMNEKACTLELKLSSQLKLNRERIGLSQEAAAQHIFVSRQTMSSWETGKTYPDVQSLLLLSGLFGISIDELVKGDMDIMREVVSKDALSMSRLTGAAMATIVIGIACCLIICAVFHAPAFGSHIPVGFFAGLPVLIAASVIACICEYRVELIKKKHNLVAFSEIMAFMNGKGVDSPIPINESAFSRIHPMASNLVKVLCGAAAGLAITLTIELIIALLA